MADRHYDLMNAMREHVLGSRMTQVVVKTGEFKTRDFADQGTHAPGAITYFEDHPGFAHQVPAHYQPMMAEATTKEKPKEGESWSTYVPLLLIGTVLAYVFYSKSIRASKFFSFGFNQ